jgi:mono/diheme cytochrome c family protein
METVVGLAIVAAASFLASTVPGTHETPIWPFSWQFSLITVREDPDLRQEVIVSLLAIGAAMLLVAAALLWRRLRTLAFCALALAIAWRGPSLSLLTIEAFPTSFQTSPTGFSAASIVRGQALFIQDCAACHGSEGEGDGRAAAALRIKPADLTQAHVREHTDGEMFWWMTHGIDDPEGGLAMPGFGLTRSDDDRWALIDYVRAHNVGAAAGRDATLEVPVRAPELSVACNGVEASTMADLLGHAVLVVLGESARDRRSVPARDAVTLVVAARDAERTPGSCSAVDKSAWDAYAILAGGSAEAASGSEFLIDPNGWLRAVQRPGEADGWRSREALLAAISRICAQPVELASGGSHEHHH